MLCSFDNEQLPAVAWITQPTASGQASEAGHAVRKAHSEKPLDRPENECIHFLAGPRFFLCPEALATISKLQAQIVCCYCQAGSPAEVQEMKSPGAELETAEVSNVSSFANYCLSKSHSTQNAALFCVYVSPPTRQVTSTVYSPAGASAASQWKKLPSWRSPVGREGVL